MNNIDKLKRISTPAEENWFEIAKEWEREDKEMDKLKHEVTLPDGYIFKDENGNELEDIEDDNVTLNEFCKKHNL